jgi:hypothetical protein
VGEIHFIFGDDTQRAWDVDGQVWVSVSGSTVVDATAASGGGIKGKITVDSDKGLAVASGVLSASINTSGGLQFNSSSKAIEAKLEANKGLGVGANGLAITLNGTTLSLGAPGIAVAGLPSLFTVNGTAVGANVTAANLDILTGSGSTTLHTHAATVATKAPILEAAYAVSVAIAAGDPVYWSTTNDRVGKADAGDSTKIEIIGVARVGQATPGSDATIVHLGICPSVLTSATAGAIYYVADTGGLTATLPAAGKNICIAGYAKNATDLMVQPRFIGLRAA